MSESPRTSIGPDLHKAGMESTLRCMKGEDLITHLGQGYYD
jgi:hypothetical protein